MVRDRSGGTCASTAAGVETARELSPFVVRKVTGGFGFDAGVSLRVNFRVLQDSS